MKKTKQQHILIVDDEVSIRNQLSSFLESKGFMTDTAANGKDALNMIREKLYDVALLDFRLPDMDGIELLKKLKILSSATEAIIITGYSDVRIAVNAMRSGAYEYVTKPLYVDEILMTIKSALNRHLEKKPDDSTIVFGNSRHTARVLQRVNLVAPTKMAVIISGETGTGKEYIARAIHQKSKRSKNPLVAVDCGALPENLAGSELFGHMKGAFTGALKDKKGSFEMANEGTLFLDEIGNLTYENQMKLLRVLQEQKVKRIGSQKQTPVDVRVIAATNENLEIMVSEGDFREDLFHRINEFDIDLLPLRERKEDIKIYLEHFLKQANEQLEKHVRLRDPDVVKRLTGYEWPGNLRELKNVVKKAVLLAQQGELTMECLPEAITGLLVHHSVSAEAKKKKKVTSLKAVTEQAEKNAILEALEQTGYNKTEAARVLKVNRKTLYNKMRIHDINLEVGAAE